MKKKIVAIEIPKFRYLDDIQRFLTKMAKEVEETGKLVLQQQKLLASTMRKVDTSCIQASMVFNVTPSDRKDQLKTIRKMKTKIDPGFTKVVIPNMKKLESQYNLAEDLYAKHKAVESVETTLSLSFPNRRGPEYDATVAQLNTMKAKIADQLKICLQFLNDVATQHVPKQFTQYTQLIADMVNEHVIFKESQSFLYVSVHEGVLLFTNYLLLLDAINDEGEITPHLYISVQWMLGPEPSVSVDLNHEYEVPNKLIGSGEDVDSVGAAVKAINDMLDIESFSSALGVVPLALQLKVDPAALNPNMFVYRDFISKVIVDERTISFKLRKEADSPETVAVIAAQLYKELKGLLKSKGVRLTMRQDKVAGVHVITFTIVKIAEGGEFNATDLEFLRDKFGLTNQALRKIAQIVNNEKSHEEVQKTPQSNNLAELTKQGHEDHKKQVERTLKNRPEPKE